MKPLDVAFVTVADLPEGGGNTSRLRSLVETLTRAGHRVRIWNQHALGVAPETSRRERGVLAGAAFEHVLGTTRRGSGFGIAGAKLHAVAAVARRMLAARRVGELDLVWFNCLSFYDVAPLSALARALGVGSVQAYEDERLELVSEGRRALSRRLFGLNSRLADRFAPGWADALVVISRYLEEKYARRVRDPSRIHLIPTLVDCAAWELPPESAPGPDAPAPMLLYTGGFGEQDDLEGIVDALALVRDAGRRFRGVLIGGGAREAARVAAVRRRVAARGLVGRVELRGFVPFEQLRAELARASVLLCVRRDGLWSRSGLPTKLSEYLASGRCVVAAGVGDVAHYLRDGESALLVRAGATPPEIAHAFERALGSQELRRRIGAGGREVALRHFDLDAARARLDAVLESALPRGGGYRAAASAAADCEVAATD